MYLINLINRTLSSIVCYYICAHNAHMFYICNNSCEFVSIVAILWSILTNYSSITLINRQYVPTSTYAKCSEQQVHRIFGIYE